MAKKNTPKKTFPLLILVDQSNGSQRPYIARLDVHMAFQTLQITAAHVTLGDTDLGELTAQIDTLFAELQERVKLTDED